MKKSGEEKKRRRKKKNYLLRLFLVLLFSGALYGIANTSYFNVTTIEVVGNFHYEAAEVVQLSKLKTGGNLFRLDKEERISMLKQDPYIRDVEIKRKLPDTVIIHVEERREDAAVAYGESYVLIDLDGMVLRRIDQEPEVPLLVGMTLLQMQPGFPLEVQEVTVLENTLVLLSAMEDNDLFFKKIDISNVIIKAYIYDRLVCEGRPENILEAMKNGSLQLVLAELMAEGIQYGTLYLGGKGYCSFSPQVQ
jgi:cell division protein FtsQ